MTDRATSLGAGRPQRAARPDDADGTKLAAAEAAEREAARDGPDYTTAHAHAAAYPARAQLHIAGLDESVFTRDAAQAFDAHDVDSLHHAWWLMQQSIAEGRPTRLRIAPGTYRLERALSLSDLNGAAAAAPLIIEAEPGAVFSGSRVLPASWFLAVDGEPGLYVGPWPLDWSVEPPGRWGKKQALAQRREMLVIDGRLMRQRLIQDYAYDPDRIWIPAERYDPRALEAGQFAIDDDSRRVYFRLEPDQPLTEKTRIEMPFAPCLMSLKGKSNIVLRGLTMQHTVGRRHPGGNLPGTAALEFNEWPPRFLSRNVLIDDCAFRQNNGNGTDLNWIEDSVLRQCTGDQNGASGLRFYHSRRVRMEDCQGIRSGWRTGNGCGINISGRSLHLLRVRGNHNKGRGHRQDHILNGALYQDCQFNGNTLDGAFNEIAVGPVTYRACEFVGNGSGAAESKAQGAGLFVLAVDHLTVEGCRFIDNVHSGFCFEGGSRTWNDAFTPGKFKHDEPSLPGCLDYTFRNNVFSASDPQAILLARWWKQGRDRCQGNHEKYTQMIRRELTSDGNTFWHSARTDVFDISDDFFRRDLTDLAGWRQHIGQDTNSRWAEPNELPQATTS
jgi:hypothetical protein